MSKFGSNPSLQSIHGAAPETGSPLAELSAPSTSLKRETLRTQITAFFAQLVSEAEALEDRAVASFRDRAFDRILPAGFSPFERARSEQVIANLLRFPKLIDNLKTVLASDGLKFTSRGEMLVIEASGPHWLNTLAQDCGAPKSTELIIDAKAFLLEPQMDSAFNSRLKAVLIHPAWALQPNGLTPVQTKVLQHEFGHAEHFDAICRGEFKPCQMRLAIASTESLFTFYGKGFSLEEICLQRQLAEDPITVRDCFDVYCLGFEFFEAVDLAIRYFDKHTNSGSAEALWVTGDYQGARVPTVSINSLCSPNRNMYSLEFALVQADRKNIGHINLLENLMPLLKEQLLCSAREVHDHVNWALNSLNGIKDAASDPIWASMGLDGAAFTPAVIDSVLARNQAQQAQRELLLAAPAEAPSYWRSFRALIGRYAGK